MLDIFQCLIAGILVISGYFRHQWRWTPGLQNGLSLSQALSVISLQST